MENAKDIIVELLKNKSTLKQNVFANTKHWFSVFKEELNECIDIIKKDIDDPIFYNLLIAIYR